MGASLKDRALALFYLYDEAYRLQCWRRGIWTIIVGEFVAIACLVAAAVGMNKSNAFNFATPIVHFGTWVAALVCAISNSPKRPFFWLLVAAVLAFGIDLSGTVLRFREGDNASGSNQREKYSLAAISILFVIIDVGYLALAGYIYRRLIPDVASAFEELDEDVTMAKGIYARCAGLVSDNVIEKVEKKNRALKLPDEGDVPQYVPGTTRVGETVPINTLGEGTYGTVPINSNGIPNYPPPPVPGTIQYDRAPAGYDAEAYARAVEMIADDDVPTDFPPPSTSYPPALSTVPRPTRPPPPVPGEYQYTGREDYSSTAPLVSAGPAYDPPVEMDSGVPVQFANRPNPPPIYDPYAV